uniref:Transglutaminase-like domain-containing protein n=2 Tax=Sphenodon punctatus TaxID=8508 RepID=A0A8D0GHW3_SPHPU
MCSVLRCLGIPTRIVTGFAWAQDTAGSLWVEEHHDETGALLPRRDDIAGASVWAFHAWTECWMARSDLPPGYGGWQALDALPQEKSQGPSCCGPAPVQAIKEGNVELPYDVPYLFAAVNAKTSVWVHGADGSCQRAASSPKYVGNNLSTKGVGSERCEDITQHYKHPEDSAQEREVLENTCRKLQELKLLEGSGIETAPSPEGDAPLLCVFIQAESSVLLGQDVHFSVTVCNRSAEARAVQLVLGAQALQYNGAAQAQLWKEEFHFTLKDNHGESMQHRDGAPSARPSLAWRDPGAALGGQGLSYCLRATRHRDGAPSIRPSLAWR